MSYFDSYRRSAPRVPDETCPAIDNAISEVDSAAAALAAITSRNGLLEELRSANAGLRDLAHYWREAAEEMCAEVDRLSDRVSELESELDAATKQRAA